MEEAKKPKLTLEKLSKNV